MKIAPYIKFLWKSTNAHGVHSPFVFDLVTKCFYAKDKNPAEASLLYRIVKYFDPETVYISGNDKDIEIIPGINTITVSQPQKAEFAFISHKKQTAALHTFEQLLPSITSNTILIYNHIHASPQMEKVWAVIKNHEKTTVTIDTFKYGLVFFREEQQKEHFIIRPFTCLPLDIVLGARKLWGLIS